MRKSTSSTRFRVARAGIATVAVGAALLVSPTAAFATDVALPPPQAAAQPAPRSPWPALAC
jgi:hypothetical protein